MQKAKVGFDWLNTPAVEIMPKADSVMQFETVMIACLKIETRTIEIGSDLTFVISNRS